VTVPACAVDGRAAGSRIPPGWQRNPSEWPARIVLICLALAGAAVAGYLTLVQVRALGAPWDPVFGSASSDRVLHSSLSRSLPVPDAGLGLLAYLADVVLNLVGGTDRWRTRPAVPLLFAAVVLGSAVAGVGLVVVQAAVVGSFCTLCLVSAGLSVAILAVSRLDEARASLAHLRRS
jgi:uncharacterized membrane protein